jgi:hypothetical protein
MAKIQIKNSFITSSADITISSSLVKFSGGISVKNITGSFSGSIPQLSSYFKQGGNSFGTTATLGTNDNQALIFETNNTERARIDTSGNLGIGTSSPGYKLHVFSTGNNEVQFETSGTAVSATNRLRFKNASGASDVRTGVIEWYDVNTFKGDIRLLKAGGIQVRNSSDTPTITLDDTGNLGIGTTGPAYLLDVVSTTINPSIRVRSNGGIIGNYGELILQSYNSFSGVGQAFIRGISTASGNSNTSLTFGVNESGFGTPYEAMRILHNGNVGIGTTSPSTPLHVFNTAATLATFTRDLATDVGFTIGADTNGVVLGTLGVHAIQFYTNATEKVRITSDGNVGIGTSTVGNKLTVVTSTQYDGYYLRNVNGVVGTMLGVSATNDDGTIGLYSSTVLKTNITANGASYFNGGNVGIGTSSPSAKLHVTGSGTFGTALQVVGQSYFNNVVANTSRNQITINANGANYGQIYDVGVSAYNALAIGGSANLTSVPSTPIMTWGLSSGNVGIGTTNPANKLSVISGSTRIASSALAGALYLGSDTSFIYLQRDNNYDLSLVQNGDSNSALYLASAGSVYVNIDANNNDSDKAFIVQNNALKAGTELFRVSETGNVGIGTSSPAAFLNIVGNGTHTILRTTSATSYTTLRLYNDQNSSVRALEIDYSGASYSGALITSGPTGESACVTTTGAYPLAFGTNNTARMTILSGGNVGIGSSTPAYKLDVTGDVYSSNYYSVLTAASYGPSDASATMQVFGSVGSGGLTNTIKFVTGGSERVRITSGGYVGIGTSTTTSGLQIQTEGTNTTSGSFLFVRSINASFGGGAIGVGYDYAAAVGNNFYPFRIRAGSTNAIFTINSTGVVYAGDTTGAVAYGNHDPYYTFNQDTNTGMDWAAADTLTFKTGGSERLRITSGGNIGIGTSSPLERITFGSSDSIIARSSATDFNSGYCSRILFNQGGTGYGYLGFYTYQGGTGGGERMRITESGNVGIGITVPGGKLHVVGSSYISASANTTNIKFEGGGGNGLAFGTIDATSTYASWIQSGYVLNFVLATYNLLLQPLGGNVGIGLTSPSYNLSIGGSVGLQGNEEYLYFHSNYSVGNNARGKIRVVGAGGGSGYGGDLRFSTRKPTNVWNEDALTIDSSGNVGIGTTSPKLKLDIAGAGAGSIALTNTGTSGYSEVIFYEGSSVKGDIWVNGSAQSNYAGANSLNILQNSNAPMAFYTNGNNERMRIAGDGNVGIGTSSPIVKLQVVGANETSFASAYTGNPALIALYGTDAYNSGTAGGGVFFGGKFNSSDNTTAFATISGIKENSTDTNFAGALTFMTRTDGSGAGVAERMRISSTGNVGIGTTSPTAKLDVSGTSFLRGDLNAGKTANLNITTALNGTGGGNRGFDTSFTGASATGFTGSDNTDQGFAYFAATIISGRSYEVSATMVVTNGAPLSFRTSTGLNFATQTVQIIIDPPVSNTTYSFVATADAAFFGIGINRTSGTMTAVVSNVSVKEVGSVLVASNSNVGIGTTSPATKLDVKGNVFVANAANGNNTIAFGNIGTLGPLNGAPNNLTGSAFLVVSSSTASGAPSHMKFFTTTGGVCGERMRLAADGNVGIGSTSPAYKLDVVGTARVGDTFLITTGATADARLEVGSGRSGNGNSYIDLVGDATYTDYGLRLIRYDTGANAGSRLEHKGTGQFQLFAAEAASVTISTTSTERMRITSAGDLLVGRTSGGLDNTSGVTISQSSIGMQTEGNAAQIIMNRTTSDGTIVEIRRNNIAVGTISVTTTATAYNTTSDYRLKELIKPISAGLSRINSLKPSVYNWKSDGSDGEGFLAHELAEVVPLAVTGQKDALNDDGSINPQSVDLSKIVPILVASIQELSGIVKQQQIEIDDLKSKVNK